MDIQHFSPSMLTYTDPEFDYGPLLPSNDEGQFQQQQQYPPQQHQILSHAAGYSDSSSMGPGRTTPPGSDTNKSSSAISTELARKQPQRQRLERRGHTKSRRGCYNCKRRRIKCQETQPACGHCVKTGLKCEYPALPQIIHQPHHQIPLFSLQDMRFFQHFLTMCIPRHPLKQEHIWTHEIPCIAHNHEFLMHAILGYAASELISSDQSLVTASMSHRVKAIKAIKKRLTESARVSMTYEEANALIATCFALTFQSVSLEDGMAEYMTFIRGIVIVGMQMAFKGIQPIFTTIFEPDQGAILAPLMEGLPLIQKEWADSAHEGISNLRPLCVEPVEIEYYEKLMAIVEKLYVNSYDAYKANSAQYGWWMMLSHPSFQELINPNNQVIMLLHSHWIALSQIMVFITQQEYAVSERVPPKDPEEPIDPGFIRWLKYLISRVDYEHQIYNQWPMWVDAQLDKDITFFGKTR